ncbi:MAG: PTS sugar transporter subunit IIA [Candidatus Dadabacteria bacterium]|nr:MAG: PTS sugar transporter subunit IIA [Candidatus Dadabacteria bacterium]
MGANAPAWSFREDWVQPDLRSANAVAVLEELAAPLLADLDADARTAALQALRDREKLGSTAMGDGVAIPHAKISGIDDLRVGFGRHLRGAEFGTPDGAPVQLFFVILSPEQKPGLHLQALAQVARMTRTPEARERILHAPANKLTSVLNDLLKQAAGD